MKDIDLDLPRNAWIAVCGVSGSGKSSLVIDTLAVESRRRFAGTQRHATQGVDLLPRPDVDSIDSLPPAVLYAPKHNRGRARETLGTLTDIARGLQYLFARAAKPHCDVCGSATPATGRRQIGEALLAHREGTKVWLMVDAGKGPEALEAVRKQGLVRVRIDREHEVRIDDVEDAPASHATIESVVDRLIVREGAEDRFRASIDQALSLGSERILCRIEEPDESATEVVYSTRPYCATCAASRPPLTPATFHFNRPQGACSACEGLGEIGEGDDSNTCPTCNGHRRSPLGAAAKLGERTLPELEALPARALREWVHTLEVGSALNPLVAPIRHDLLARLEFLCDLGMGGLSVGQSAQSLARGERRRADLINLCSSRMSGLLFLLDEPAAGLSQRDREPLWSKIRELVHEGNTVICVDHDPGMLAHADMVIELGPGAGRLGGELSFVGSSTDYLAQAIQPVDSRPRGNEQDRLGAPSDHWLRVQDADAKNLRGLSCRMPTGALTVITGPSGAGKTALLRDVLARHAKTILESRDAMSTPLVAFDRRPTRLAVAEGTATRHARSTPASVLGIFGRLRTFFAATLEARARGWNASYFSPHTKQGRCSACNGSGVQQITLRQLPSFRVACEECEGTRFRDEILRVRVKGYTIVEVLAMPIEQAMETFKHVPHVHRPLHAAHRVGLGYTALGEPTSHLSGGEMLRLKLAASLAKGTPGDTLYLLEEPCTGLHPKDVAHLVTVLRELADTTSTVVAADHHPLLLAAADWQIALGPGAASKGGTLIYEGPPHNRDTTGARR